MKKRLISAMLMVLLLMCLPLSCLADGERELPLVADAAGLLSGEEQGQLNSYAEQLSAKYGCDIVVITVDSLDGWNVEELTEAIYQQYHYGFGAEKSGVILLLSMEERDYDMSAYGYGNVAFTNYGKEMLMESVLPYLGRDDWFAGFYEFIALCGSFLDAAQNNAPVDVNSGYSVVHQQLDPGPGLTPGKLIAALLVGLAAALIVTGVQKTKMKSAVIQTRADRYMDELKLDGKEDRYLRTTKTRVRRESNSGSRGGGGTHVNSGGFSHHSGKF